MQRASVWLLPMEKQIMALDNKKKQSPHIAVQQQQSSVIKAKYDITPQHKVIFSELIWVM